MSDKETTLKKGAAPTASAQRAARARMRRSRPPSMPVGSWKPLGGDRLNGDGRKEPDRERNEDREALVTGWKPLPTEVQAEMARTENGTRRWISLGIVFVFVTWVLGGGGYLVYHAADIQALLAWSAFISGPLGVVIGYYFGVGEEARRR